jgi:hypothetical protein
MLTRRTPWHTLAIVLGACTSSHVPGECEDELGTCMDECCENQVEPTYDADCNATCPAGLSLIDRCAPRPECEQDCPVSDDAGVTITCAAGPCCLDVAQPIQNADCTFSCPSGYSTSCVPGPDVRCATPWHVCDQPSDCELAPADACCFPCSNASIDDLRAINGAHRDDFYAMCDAPACPPCAPVLDPSFRPTCSDGMCDVVDVRALELSACNSDTDCALRVTDCCECGGDLTSLIAIRADAGASYAELVCDPAQACDLCAPVYPTDVEAFCAADGHCGLRPRP